MSSTDVSIDESRERPRRRAVLGVVLAAGALCFVVTKRADAPLAWHALLTASPPWVVVAVVASVGFMVNQALFHRSAQRALGVHVPFRELWRSSNASFFVNSIARAGGLAGVVAFTPSSERHGQSRARTVAAFLIVTILSQMSFAASLAAAVVVLGQAGSITRVDVIGSLVFGVYTLLLGTAVVVAVRSRSMLRRLYAVPARAKRRLMSGLGRPGSNELIETGAADDFYDAVQLVRSDPRLLLGPVGYALMVEVLGVALLWAVLRAVGGNIGVTGALVAYSVSVMFLIISILPGGLGFVEASLGVVLTGYGLAAGKAAAAVIIYRVLQLWLPFGAGALSFRKATATPVTSSTSAATVGSKIP